MQEVKAAGGEIKLLPMEVLKRMAQIQAFTPFN